MNKYEISHLSLVHVLAVLLHSGQYSHHTMEEIHDAINDISAQTLVRWLKDLGVNVTIKE